MTHAATIAAIATPPGRGAIGVVRVSGSGLETLVAGIVGRVPAPRVATFATFRDADGNALDQGLALWFPAPHSYTGESVLELQGHGGGAVLRAVLARVVELGARLAEPGEFTRRAFLNGKLDLAQAEAVADLIDAATSTAARAATRSLSGEFSRAVAAIVAALVELRTFTEATLDFPDEELDFLKATDARGKLAGLREEVAALQGRARAGALLREGLVVALIGQPNVGKSSLLNCLAREDAAIVTPLPGTTRDPIERAVEIAGVPVAVVDTAGLRETSDAIESLGIGRTLDAIARADLALLLVDARDPPDALSAADRAILARLPVDLPRIIVHNKTDLAGVAPRVETRATYAGPRRHVWLSARDGDGVTLLEDEVREWAVGDVGLEDTFTARARHLAALADAAVHLDAAARELHAEPPPLELFAEELRYAQDALATITGEFSADDLLGAIFSRFCIGK